MKKWVSFFTFVLLIMVMMPLTGCTSRDIAAEVAQSLIQMNKTGVENIDSEITKTDKQLYDAQVHLLKLEQVLNAALEWVDYQKEVSRPGEWDIKVTPDGLAQLHNDQFEVTALEVLISRDSLSVTQSSYTLKIREFASMQVEDGDALHDHLVDSQNFLEQNRAELVAARDLSVSTMNNVLKYVNDWKIKKVSGTIYNVSGPGLGWAEQLASGTWKYDRDKATLIPDDNQADNLNTIILGN
ncbi:MAG: hypothetical protein JSV54_08590 [Chloroflexota bacterium]|nr:MAG: hypothetical protein JSV54_08590 [Chloroflexota bacterium]